MKENKINFFLFFFFNVTRVDIRPKKFRCSIPLLSIFKSDIEHSIQSERNVRQDTIAEA